MQQELRRGCSPPLDGPCSLVPSPPLTQDMHVTNTHPAGFKRVMYLVPVALVFAIPAV